MCENKTPRKKFLQYLAGFTITGGLLGQLWMFLRSIKPNVLYEPVKKFKIGPPAKFPEGITFLSKERLFIIKEKNKFQAMSAICTHLGCTVNKNVLKKEKKVVLPNGKELTQKWEFSCPCHGSKYRGDGTIYDGPAPENLPPWHLSLGADGNIVVDTNKQVEKSFRLIQKLET